MAVIQVYADVCCPFTHVGLRRLAERRDSEGRADVVLRVMPWPLELVNGRPLDPVLIAEEVEEIREQVAPDLFAGFDVDAFPASSVPAMALAARAYEVSDQVGERVSLALRDALFERGLDIADPEVLEAVAAECGVTNRSGDHSTGTDADLVRDGWERGREHGVIGSPHFFLHEQGFFCPALHIERIDGRLHITADEQFDRFVERAFAT